MIIMTIQHLSKAFGGNEVLRDVNLVLQEGQRMGLVGVNGCGKTTLLRILTGQEHADDGNIAISRALRVGYMAQHGDIKPGNTVYDELVAVFEPVHEMEARLRQMEEQMTKVTDEQELIRLGEQYARLNDAFEKADGYQWQSNILGVLAGLGFKKEQHSQPAQQLSGGEMTRLCLAKLLLQKPDLLLLDEPTNHLDLDALSWLEKYLSDYRGTLLVVSHDRYFLDHVCTHIAELLLGSIEQYNGNYSVYMTQRAERFESRMRAYELQQKEIARQEAIIARYRSFNREKSIRAAESREKRLDKLERLEKPQDERHIRFQFEAKRRTGEDVLMIKELKKSFGTRVLFEHLHLHLHAGDRVALIGPNGIGKSTLFHCLTGTDVPDGGVIRWGTNVDVGYYDQHQRGLHDKKTVLDEVWDDFPRMEQTDIRSALGLFLLQGEDVFMPIHTLSGGEKGRVALTKLMLRKDNVLLLDEPTNHLDMDSREVLEDALADYTGTILAISHDRYFINRFATHIAVLGEQGITLFEGNYDDYVSGIERAAVIAQEDPALIGKTRTEITKEKRKSRLAKEQLKVLKQQARDAEKLVSEAEQALAIQEACMAQAEIYAVPERAATAAKEYQTLKDALDAAYAVWELAEQAWADAQEEE